MSIGFTDTESLVKCRDERFRKRSGGGFHYAMRTLVEALSLTRLTKDAKKLALVVDIALSATLSRSAWERVRTEMTQEALRKGCPRVCIQQLCFRCSSLVDSFPLV